MTRFEREYYADINSIAKTLDRIANALESNKKDDKVITAVSTTGDKIYYKTRRDMYMVNPCTKEEYEAEQAELYTDDIKAQDDALNKETQEELDTQHDYLHDLVQDMDNDDYQEFCNTHCLRASDSVEVSNYITDLDYSEVLGAIREIEASNGISDDQANEDAIELKHGHFSEKIGVPYDDDYDLRCTARMYADELKHGHFSTKKDCILDYVTNEFGSQGARYTDIIKFAYYLNNDHSPKFGYENRGYYSMGISGRRPHLACGGKDFLVKGINKDNDERYFALSHVESVTEYWKYIGGTHGYM